MTQTLTQTKPQFLTEALIEVLNNQWKVNAIESNRSVYHQLEVEEGRKYLKVVQNDGGVHAFVDRKTGEVYKPASWKSPAKHVRFDLRIINDRELLHNPKFTDWAGGYLYMR